MAKSRPSMAQKTIPKKVANDTRTSLRNAGKVIPNEKTRATTATKTGAGVSASGGRGKSINQTIKGIGVTRNFIGTKRMRKLTKDNIRAVTKGDIRRLARRGGVKRISGSIYDEIRKSMKSYLENVLKETCDVVEFAQRKTVSVTDVIFVLRRIGRPVYGFDHLGHLKNIRGVY